MIYDGTGLAINPKAIVEGTDQLVIEMPKTAEALEAYRQELVDIPYEVRISNPYAQEAIDKFNTSFPNNKIHNEGNVFAENYDRIFKHKDQELQ